jgi:hypothetical protein
MHIHISKIYFLLEIIPTLHTVNYTVKGKQDVYESIKISTAILSSGFIKKKQISFSYDQAIHAKYIDIPILTNVFLNLTNNQ